MKKYYVRESDKDNIRDKVYENRVAIHDVFGKGYKDIKWRADLTNEKVAIEVIKKGIKEGVAFGAMVDCDA